MKKLLVIACLTAFSLTMWGEVSTTTHRFISDSGMSFNPGYTVGTMADGTVYTCYGTAKFKDQSGVGVCIELPVNQYFVVSPHNGLKEVDFYHSTSANIIMDIYISTNGSDWTQLTTPYFDKGSRLVKGQNLSGDYYVKLVNTSGSTRYIIQATYYTEPCHCLQVVSE